MKNNKGFSLVELLITVTVLSVVSVVVLLMMSSGSNLFTSLSLRNGLQYHSQLTMAQMQEYVIDANGGIYAVNDAEGNTTELYITDKQNFKLYVFKLDNGSLLFGANDVTVTAADITVSTAAHDLMCEDVARFSIDAECDSESRAAALFVTLVLERNGRSLEASQTYALRNLPVYASSEGTLENVLLTVWGDS